MPFENGKPSSEGHWKLFQKVKSRYPTALIENPYRRKKGRDFCLDIAIPELKVNIEYDETNIHENKKSDDKERDAILKDGGWQIIRIKDTDSAEEVNKKIGLINMPWKYLIDVPENLRTHKGIPLTLSQVNRWAEMFDKIKESSGAESPAAVAWSQWEKEYQKSEDGKSWVKIKPDEKIATSLSAVSQHETPKADIETDWDATVAELNIRKWASSDGSGDKDKIDWDKYRLGFAWYNNDDIENLESYKLPHHDIIDGELNVVWKGVSAAMAALLGARGGVIIPSEDKKGVYMHLSGHYEQFEKDIPELSHCDDFYSAITPKFEQLSDEDAKRTGQTELLLIDGTAIAEGFWKNTEFPADVVKDALGRASNLRVDVEHEDDTWENVKGFNYKPRWNDDINGIDISGVVFDERVIEWYKRNPDTKIGLSVKLNEKANFEFINGKKTCTYLDFKGIALTLNPACKVCWLKSAEIVQLSDSSEKIKTDGGTKMAEKPKTPEELAAEKKLEEEKLAEAKKLEAEKLEAEKKLADEKAKEKELKDKEDAATAKAAAADSTLSAEVEKRFSVMEAKINTLTEANATLNNERSLSETNAMVNGLIESGQLSEAKRTGTTQVLMALSSDEDRAAFLNTIGGQEIWNASEKGLVLSEDKDKDKDTSLEFSEPERGVFT